MRKSFFLAVLLTLWLIPFAQIHACRIIPNPPPVIVPSQPALLPIQVKNHHVDITIKNGIALTVLESEFYNPNSRMLEGTYLFPLPKGASISRFSMWIDGKEMPAELLDANKARDLYVSIVQRMVDPGLLEFVGRETFKMRIFPIPANGPKKVKLAYEQILPVDGNLMRYVYPLTTVGNGRDDVLGKLSWQVKISSKIPLKSVFSPSHKVKVIKEDSSATVTFEGTNVHPDRDFVLYISRSNKKVDLTMVPFCKKGEDGYFMMMLSPQTKFSAKEANPKDVVFVFDTSGSMVGKKMEQGKEALKYCLNMLRPEDRFNIIPFATEAAPYRDALLDASAENIKKALEFVEEDVYARGGTNIEEALGYALEMAPKSGNRPYMVIFMTDGKPTIGIIDRDEIVAKTSKAGCKNLRLFTFGIGNQINTRLLDLLAEGNRGAREYVGEREDIEIKVSSFFDKVSSPVLSDIKIYFPTGSKLRVSEVYPHKVHDLFKGSHITLLGRYKGSGDQAIRIAGTMGGKPREFVYEVSFPEADAENDQVPRLWAVRKVGFLLDQIRLNGENKELKKEVVRLAKRFGIVTPYTSYLVVEDEPIPQPITSTTGPHPLRRGMREAFAGNGMKDNDDMAMDKESGESAVKTSRKLRSMKGAETLDERRPGKAERQRERKNLRKIAEKTFYLQDGVWYDSQCDSGVPEKNGKIRIRYLSDKYIQLLKDFPEMGKFLAIGPKLMLLWQNRIYEIYQ